MEEEVLLPNLPNEITIQCIARVPRSFHHNLSSVCRSWRSLLSSPFFYSTRSHFNCTQQFLYINFTFTNRPIDKCWEAGPKMMIPRRYPSTTVVNGRIYVVGGLRSLSSFDPWVEVFYPRLGSWTPLYCPMNETGEKHECIYGCADVAGKLLVIKSGYDGEEKRWKELKGLKTELQHRPFTNIIMMNVEGRLWVLWRNWKHDNEWEFDGKSFMLNYVLQDFQQDEKDFVLRECKKDENYFVLWEVVVRGVHKSVKTEITDRTEVGRLNRFG
ncbi:F-box/kelch-repeat protein At4g39550-like [Tasmannia lanceolata]|uniref:F-box/kelch-repeat protein At4g39550-like n=1 Tax=Tasmannia lanceolata TaxID=3420 RepID=UPI004063A767